MKLTGVVGAARLTSIDTSFSPRKPRRIAADVKITGKNTSLNADASPDFPILPNAFLKSKSAPIHRRANGVPILPMYLSVVSMIAGYFIPVSENRNPARIDMMIGFFAMPRSVDYIRP